MSAKKKQMARFMKVRSVFLQSVNAGENMEPKYAEDKPKDCAYCYFWQGKKQGCLLGKESCYYLIKKAPEKKSPCDGCPYGKGSPCVSFCMMKVLGKNEDGCK